MSLSVYVLFITTFFFVSITPGMCMTLAMTLGMTVGVRRTLWMMLGELIGVGLVVVLTIIGAAALMLQYPQLFLALKWGGGAYLMYLGIQLWRSRGKMAIKCDAPEGLIVSRASLFSQGFITAVANPKGWAFFIALLPPFIDNSQPLLSQAVIMIAIILLLEFLSLIGYAGGGKALSHLLRNRGNVQVMNRIAGTLMIGVSVWLALG
ncbi:MAG TPA: LysE family translocator [Marinobacterium sp.]|nr:LysE family translocator [Marinobacterium sp.]